MSTRRISLLLALLFLAGCIGVPIHGRTKKKPIPESTDALPYEWVEIPAAKDVVLRGIYAPNEGPPVLLLYGAGMGIAGIWEAVTMLHDGGYAVLCCDYRGTGYSSGRWWTSRYLDDDARVLYEWLLVNKGERVGVLGVSIGAIAGAGLADHPTPPAALVLDRPVDPRTIVGRYIGKDLGAFARFVSALLVHAKCDVKLRERFAAATAPTLLVLPQFDVLCPPEDVARFTEGAAATVERAVVPGGHVSSHLVDPVRWRTTVLDFLDARLRPGEPPKGGRSIPPDPMRVVEARMEACTLHVRLEGEVPARLRLLVMGRKANAFIEVPQPGRELSFPLERKQVKRLGEVFAVRAVPQSFRRAITARWIVGEQPPKG